MKTSTFLFLLVLIVALFYYLISPEMQRSVSPTYFWIFMAFGAFRVVMSLISDKQTNQLDAQIAEGQGDAITAETADAGDPAEGGQQITTVMVYRLSNFVGSMGPIYVFCDEKPIANLKNGSYMESRVSAGEHVFSSSASTSTLTVTINPAEEYFLQTGVIGIGKSAFAFVSSEQARREMKLLKRITVDV